MRRVKAISIAAVVLLVCMTVLSLCLRDGVEFSKEAWVNATPQLRDRLMEGLAGNRVLVGLSEFEVEAMLGEPDGASFGSAIYYFRPGERSRPCIIFDFTREGIVQSSRLSSMGGTVSEDKFDAEKWRTGKPADRLRMVLDLLATQSLVGMRSDDLYQFLGAPDRLIPTGPRIWYCQRYYGPDGKLRKRFAGASKCLYVFFRDGFAESAEYAGS